MVEFRKKVLTIMGAVGYTVALLLILIDVLPTYNVPLQSIFIALGTSSALLGVDFGIDVLWTSNKDRPVRNAGSGTTTQHGDETQTDKGRN